MSTVAFYTLGCKVNHYETEAIWQLFKQHGYERVDFETNADVYRYQYMYSNEYR